jgi:hypothetical protein
LFFPKFYRQAIEATGVNVTNIITIHDSNWPKGCILTPKVSDSFSAIFNAAESSTSCGNTSKVALKGSAQLGPQVQLDLKHDLVTGVFFSLSIFGRKPNSNYFHFFIQKYFFLQYETKSLLAESRGSSSFFINKSGIQI